MSEHLIRIPWFYVLIVSEPGKTTPTSTLVNSYSSTSFPEAYYILLNLLPGLQNWLGCWAGVFAAMLWFAADGSRYSSRMQQPSSGSTALSLLITSASTAFCYLMRASPGKEFLRHVSDMAKSSNLGHYPCASALMRAACQHDESLGE